MVVHSGQHVGTLHSKEHWETFCEGNGSFTAMMMQKTRGKQNALPAPGLKIYALKGYLRIHCQIDVLYKNVGSSDWDKAWKFWKYIYHTHIWCVCLVPRPWTAWVRHGTMGLKCGNVTRIMRLDAPSFRTTYLTISTLVVGQKTKGILKAGAATYRFVGKVYWWRVGREKRNLQGHQGVCRSLLAGY